VTGIGHPINQKLNIEFQVAKTLLGLASAWVFTWTPYAVVALMGISGYGHLLTVKLFCFLNWRRAILKIKWMVFNSPLVR